MPKEIKEKVIEILEKVDDTHTDGYLMRDYQEKLADQILSLFEAETQSQKEELIREVEKELNLIREYERNEIVADVAIKALQKVIEIIKKGRAKIIN